MRGSLLAGPVPRNETCPVLPVPFGQVVNDSPTVVLSLGNQAALQIGLEILYADVTFKDLRLEAVSLDGDWSESRIDLNQPIAILSVPIGVTIWL